MKTRVNLRGGQTPHDGRIAQPSLAKIFSVSVLGGGIGRLGYFVALTTLAWLVSPESFGRFSALYSSLQVISGVIGASSSIASTRLAAETSPKSGLTKGTLRPPLYFGALGGIIGALSLPWAYGLLTDEPAELMTSLVGLAAILSVSCDGILGAYAGAGRYRMVSSCEALRGILSLAAVLLTANMGPHVIALGILVCEGSIAFAMWMRAPSASSGRTFQRRQLRAALAIVVTGMTGTALIQVASWSLNYAIAHRLGIVELGAYSMANRFATFALVLPGLLTRNTLGRLSSQIAARDHVRFSREFRRYSVVSISLALFAGLFALALSWWPMQALFVKYENARWFLIVLIAASLPSALGSALGVALVSLNLRRWWLVSDVTVAIVTLGCLVGLLNADTPAVMIVWALPAGQFAGTVVRLTALAIWRRGRLRVSSSEALQA